MSALAKAPDSLDVQGKGGGLVLEERTEKQISADLRLMTKAVKRWPARISAKILNKMAEEGWRIVNSTTADDRAKVHALKFLQALLSLNAKLAMKAYDKRVKSEDAGQSNGGTCIKVYNNVNILNV